MVRVSAVSPQNRQGFSCNSVGLNRGGYKQNTELTTGGDTAEGNINEVATKGGTGYRGAAMFPSGRKKRDKREKGKNPAYRKSGRQLLKCTPNIGRISICLDGMSSVLYRAHVV